MARLGAAAGRLGGQLGRIVASVVVAGVLAVGTLFGVVLLVLSFLLLATAAMEANQGRVMFRLVQIVVALLILKGVSWVRLSLIQRRWCMHLDFWGMVKRFVAWFRSWWSVRPF